jgi:hypothetical protein
MIGSRSAGCRERPVQVAPGAGSAGWPRARAAAVMLLAKPFGIELLPLVRAALAGGRRA